MVRQGRPGFPEHLSAVWRLILQQLISPVFRWRDYTRAISERGTGTFGNPNKKKIMPTSNFHTRCFKYAHASRGESWLCETQYCCCCCCKKEKRKKKRSQSKYYNQLRRAANARSPVGWVTMWNGHGSFCFTDAWSLWPLFHRLKHSRPVRLRWLLLMHWATLTNALTAHCNASS